MKRLAVVCLLAVVMASLGASVKADKKPPSTAPSFSAQQPVRIGANEIILFDYEDVVMVNEEVTRFEAQFDAGTIVNLGIPAKIPSGEPGKSSYKVEPIRTSGTHNLIVRACNAEGCSGWTQSPFVFAPLGAPSTVPGNIRKGPR